MTTRLWGPLLLLFLASCTTGLQAGILRQNRTLLLCHRTANRDMPENTLESLALAARMGCDIIEVDVTRTLDGELVLNHDNFLDRFTNTTGEVENTDLKELDRMDFGAWRGERFWGMHIAHFDDALRLARKLHVSLYLDIKSKGIGAKVLETLRQEQMTDQVIFGGEWEDVKALEPNANRDDTASVEPGFSAAELADLHFHRKVVIANFSANIHETDLAAMRAAVAAGVDGIMVDYPRLGADAVGRPVEKELGRLTKLADNGSREQRLQAIRTLAEYTSLPLQREFLRWVEDADELISHQAALALVSSHQPLDVAMLQTITHSTNPATRRSAAWLIGTLSAERSNSADCVPLLTPLLDDPDSAVVKEALLAITWCPIAPNIIVSEVKLAAFLHSPVPILRGLAACALARFHPESATMLIRDQIDKEEAEAAAYDAKWAARGRAKLTQAEIDELVEKYRAQMKFIQSLAMLPQADAVPSLEQQAFRSVHDYSESTALVAGYQLWDRLEQDPQPAIMALSSSDRAVADRAEWALVEADPEISSAVRQALKHGTGQSRMRLIEVVAWRCDSEALPLLTPVQGSPEEESKLLLWATRKIADCGQSTGQ